MLYVRRQNSQKVMMWSEVGLHLSSLQKWRGGRTGGLEQGYDSVKTLRSVATNCTVVRLHSSHMPSSCAVSLQDAKGNLSEM